jgi:hypothetical protein
VETFLVAENKSFFHFFFVKGWGSYIIYCC